MRTETEATRLAARIAWLIGIANDDITHEIARSPDIERVHPAGTPFRVRSRGRRWRASFTSRHDTVSEMHKGGGGRDPSWASFTRFTSVGYGNYPPAPPTFRPKREPPMIPPRTSLGIALPPEHLPGRESQARRTPRARGARARDWGRGAHAVRGLRERLLVEGAHRAGDGVRDRGGAGLVLLADARRLRSRHGGRRPVAEQLPDGHRPPGRGARSRLPGGRHVGSPPGPLQLLRGVAGGGQLRGRHARQAVGGASWGFWSGRGPPRPLLTRQRPRRLALLVEREHGRVARVMGGYTKSAIAATSCAGRRARHRLRRRRHRARSTAGGQAGTPFRTKNRSAETSLAIPRSPPAATSLATEGT